MTSIGNIEAGIKSATDQAVGVLKSIAIYGILPVACIFLLVVLLIFIIGAAKKKKMGEDFSDDLWKCVTVLVALGLVGTFTVWGWTMAGIAPTQAAAMGAMLMTRVF